MSLPILDLSQLDAGPAAAATFRDALREATHEVGFFYLVGHGIPDDVTARAFAAAERFFALPLEAKTTVQMLNSPHFRGYTRTGGEVTQGRVDWREQLDLGPDRAAAVGDPRPFMRLQGPNQWPAEQPDLREVFTDWAERCSAVAIRLMRSWALSLGSPPDVFDAAFAPDPSYLMKLIRYPGREEENGQGVGAHKDTGVLTLLMVEPGKGGLQVGHDDGWIDAPAVPGAFVVNIGELMEHATAGYLKATVHRVVSPALGQSRVSIPFFFNPSLDSAFPRLALPSELAERAQGVTDDPDNVITGTLGENMLKSRLRAHPDVAAIHHSDLLGDVPS